MKKIALLLIFSLLMFAFRANAESDVIKEVFLNLNRDYINELSNKEIAIKGLHSLAKTSPHISVAEEGQSLVLYQNQKPVEQFDFPSDIDDIDVWTAWCQNIIEEASKIDKNLETHDFELPDKFAVAVFEGLDGYSHYFSVFNDTVSDEPLKIRRPFASRIIDKILLIKILSFKKDISSNVRSAVEECSKCEALILDLRNNHGGFLDEALKIADMFLDEGIITYTLSPQNNLPNYYTAGRGDILEGKPIVILTDGLTASAAEVLAAALSEQDRAVIIGTKTYGKGSIQDVTKMDADRAMAVTTAYFYTPSGIKIDKTGLTPFICVMEDENCAPMDRFNKEEDIDLAVQYLQNGNAL